jgi:tRNA (adenine57-N1/adenine58-N1)-methyltransferase catalytic subunit
MIGHTGFLVTARRLAPGVTAPPRRRRPAKGAHSAEDEINPQPYATEM